MSNLSIHQNMQIDSLFFVDILSSVAIYSLSTTTISDDFLHIWPIHLLRGQNTCGIRFLIRWTKHGMQVDRNIKRKGELSVNCPGIPIFYGGISVCFRLPLYRELILLSTENIRLYR